MRLKQVVLNVYTHAAIGNIKKGTRSDLVYVTLVGYSPKYR